MFVHPDGQGTKWHRNIAENFNSLSRVHERYRRRTDGRTTTYSELEHEFTLANKIKYVKNGYRRQAIQQVRLLIAS